MSYVPKGDYILDAGCGIEVRFWTKSPMTRNIKADYNFF